VRARLNRAAGALALPLLALVELGAHFVFARCSPDPDSWEALRPFLEARKQPSDLLLIAPRWLDPHARKGLGPSLLPLRDLARPDEARYPRALEISALGQRAPETLGWAVEQQERLPGGFTLRTLRNPSPIEVIKDLVDEVEAGRAEVAWVQGEQLTPCPLRDREQTVATGLFSPPTMPPRRHVCGPHPLQSVGVTVHDDERFLPRRCVWAPPPQGGYLRIRFGPTELGSELRGHGSIHWTLEREQRGTPVELEAFIDDEPLGTFRHEDGQGWVLFRMPLGRHAGKVSARVELRVRSASASERHFCWEAALVR
jgi:hypothetical protein